MTRDAALAELVKAQGFSFGPTIVREANRAELPIPLALALVEQESGFRNIFGCDLGPRSSAPWCHQEVTKDRVQALLAHVKKGGTSNGVGLTQLTSIDFIHQAEAEGGAHKVEAQCRVGFRLLRGLIERNGHRTGIGAYNGGEGNPNLDYADSVLALRAKWEKRVRAAFKTSDDSVHRDLRLTDPLTEGPDVKALQRELNEIRKSHEQLSRKSLDVDGQLGEKTCDAAQRSAFIIGLSDREVAEIDKHRLSQHAQELLRDRSGLSAAARKRGEERREELHEKLERGEPDFNGHAANVTDLIKEVIVAANKAGLFVTSTTGGGHASTSHHFPQNNADGLGHAVDLAGTLNEMVAFQKKAAKQFPHALELFGPANSPWIKNGQVISGVEGTALENQHDNHVHMAR
jgi:hypothetical protein